MGPSTLPPLIIFAHANGFPASTYSELFTHWRTKGYQVHAIERLGHDPRFPVTDGWPHLVEEIHHFIQHDVRPHRDQKVFLVGHSLGGYLSLMVAHRWQGLADGVVVLDSPILNGWRSTAIGWIKRSALIDRILPSGISAQRTHEWPDKAEALRHFSSKPKFQAFHPTVLQDYIRHGTHPHPHQSHVTLAFRREVETAIYRTMPHALLPAFASTPHRSPTAFIGGTRSSELRRAGLSGTRRLFGDQVTWIDGTHLYPFEQPLRTAEEVLNWLRQFSESK